MPGSLCVATLKAFAVLAFSPHGMVSVDGRGKLFPIFVVEVGDVLTEDAVVIGKGELFWRGIRLYKCRVALSAV